MEIDADRSVNAQNQYCYITNSSEIIGGGGPVLGLNLCRNRNLNCGSGNCPALGSSWLCTKIACL